MTEDRKTIVLPSGKRGEVRKGKGRDLMRAHRASAGNPEPMSVSFALIAELARVDGSLAYPYDLRFECQEPRKFSEHRGAARGANGPIGAAAITGLIAFGFSFTELTIMDIGELAYWARATTEYLALLQVTNTKE